MTSAAAQEEERTRFLIALNDGDGVSEATAYLDAGGDINAPIIPIIEHTLLHLAAVHRKVKLIEMLAGQGADFGVRDAIGMTPLHHAVMHEMNAILMGVQEPDFPCARKLYQLGASLDAVDNNGKTPRDFAGTGGSQIRAAFDEAMVDQDD